MLIDPKVYQTSSPLHPKPAVQIDGVKKVFGATTALEPCWLKIEKGEFLTLLGPSGCGKTTLLNLIAGFLEADLGEIFIDGSHVTQVPAHQREIGIVFQNYALFPHMTVAKNVAYGLKTRGIGRDEIETRVSEALRLVKLEDFAERRPRQLSGGQQQRVALARALVIRPRVLLLDEPFSALDRNLRAAMQVELKEIQSSLGVTTVFVTHDQGEALSMSDRIAVMSRGRIRQVGTPEDIYARPANRFVGTFVGDANLLSGRLVGKTDGGATVEIAGVTLVLESATEAMPGAGIDLFARPEACALAAPDAAGAIPAKVALSVYQGSHQEVYLDCPAVAGGRAILRVPATHKVTPGEAVGILLDPAQISIFAREGDE